MINIEFVSSDPEPDQWFVALSGQSKETDSTTVKI